MLPEFPTTFVFDLLDIVVSNPIGIGVENGVAEVLHLKFIIGIDDGLDAVMIFHHVEPKLNALLKLFISLVLGFVFDIEHRGKVAVLEFYRSDKEFRLVFG